MSEEPRLLIQFVVAIVSNWLVLAGGAIMTILSIIDKLRGKEVHFKIYIKILAFLLFIAFYMSWREIKLEVGKTSQPLKKEAIILSSQLKELSEKYQQEEKRHTLTRVYEDRFSRRVNEIISELDKENYYSEELNERAHSGSVSNKDVLAISEELKKLAGKIKD
jgi:hypothetical protein